MRSTLQTPPRTQATVEPIDTFAASASFTASASLVNRTHRVVRERAEGMRTRRAQQRSIWLPVALCASLIVILCTAIWSLLDQYDLASNGIPDASNQMLVMFLWFLPVSAVILALVLGQRLRGDAETSR